MGAAHGLQLRVLEMAAVLDEVGKSEEKLINDGNVDDMDDIEGEDGPIEASKKKKRKKKKKKAGKM
jgi:methionyl aminopeptidase